MIIHTKDKSAELDTEWRNQLIQGTINSSENYVQFILNKVSRTFALNISILPAKLQHRVLLSYLFCRMADTLEDDKVLLTSEKIRLLKQFKSIFVGGSGQMSRLDSLIAELPDYWNDSKEWNHLLTYHSKIVFELYLKLPPTQIKIIAKWVSEMCEGMGEFAARENREDTNLVIPDMRELDRYCYYVAGTVGNLLCDLFYKHSRLITKKSKEKLEKLSVSFGLGLQLTNILKDVVEDLERNVVFIPQSLLVKHNLTAANFKLAENRDSARALTQTLLEKARDHLKDAVEYTCLLPRLEPRIRLFCLWPLFMAVDTLILISKTNHVYNTEKKIKINRANIKKILKETTLICFSNFLIKKKFKQRLLHLNQYLETP